MVAQGLTAFRRLAGIRRQRRPLVFVLARCTSFYRAVPFLDKRDLLMPISVCGIGPPQIPRPFIPPNLPRRRLSRLALRVSVGLAETLRSGGSVRLPPYSPLRVW